MVEQRNKELVSAAVQENMWAGIGAGLIAFCVGFVVWGASDWLIVGALVVGGVVFGLLCLLRFSLDELREWWDRERAIQMIAELEATVADQRSEIERLTKALRTREFADASKDAKEVVQADEYAGLRSNVAQVIERWAEGVSYSRDACTMSKGEWAQAMRFLRDAGVLVRGGAGGRQWVFVDSMNRRQVERAVAERFSKLEAHTNTNFVVA